MYINNTIIHKILCNVNTSHQVYNIIFTEGVRIMKSYYENIRDLREDNDLTQTDIANYLQTTQQMYSRYEKGLNELPIRHLIALCKFYNVSADYILGLEKK